LLKEKSITVDNEYSILSEIVENENVTQRELSKKLGVSVSTVNILINKMIREGLIKMTQVSQKQVFYMLTPVGMMEKAKKTVSYLKIHYRAIYEMKEKIKKTFIEISKTYDVILTQVGDDEIGEVIQLIISEFKVTHKEIDIIIINGCEDFDNSNAPIFLYTLIEKNDLIEYIEMKGIKTINIFEWI